MRYQESFNAGQIAAENKSDLARQFKDVLDARESTDEEAVVRVREMTEYFMTVLRNVPRNKVEGVGISAKIALATEVSEILKAGSTPNEKVSDVRLLIERFMKAPTTS